MEIWKDVKHYEGLYQVSNYGRVKSLERDTFMPDGTRNGHITEHIMPQHSNFNKKTGSGGYMTVILYKYNKGKKEFVHRLVAMAFIPNPDNLPQVDHINTDKLDNTVENLRWVTAKQNCWNPLTREKTKKADRSKCGAKGERNGATTHREKNLFVQQSKKVICVETGEIFNSILEASRSVGKKSSSLISACCRGKSKTAYGYHWEYYKEQEVQQIDVYN